MTLGCTIKNRVYLLGVVFFGSRGKVAMACVGARMHLEREERGRAAP